MLPPLSERKPLPPMRTTPPSLALAALLLAVLAAGHAAVAVREDECEQQRADYPKDWNDVLKAKPLFRCQSHYEGALLVSIGTPDETGRSIMNLVPIEPEGAIKLKLDDAHQVHRMWLDADQTRRLREGRYFAIRRAHAGILLDPRRPERRSRLLHGQRRRASGQRRRRRVLQQGAAHRRLQGRAATPASRSSSGPAASMPPTRGGMPCRDFAPRCS